jgi:hypothetical protein
MVESVLITFGDYVFLLSCQMEIVRRSTFGVWRSAALEVLLGVTKEVKRDALLTCGGTRETELTNVER